MLSNNFSMVVFVVRLFDGVILPYALWIFFFFLPQYAACGILIPQLGVEPRPTSVRDGVLTTGPPGHSLWFIP